ncbi:class I SAM-dependent methyltransferase [Vibrio sp. LaRot3]|uniref:class I SAM-dependent methyltransferase n=1 Tax=Vibrio sp. LaRot3 TaxID=2998829 RepID=UPI0022CDDD51|nr:class I SAM-dependent methyltransferase [Vibrio sp. LaRot3]MDA0149864.1 class I SAM-dependent methyltransferase [Vibrio sp. LaRot3]
MYSKERKVENKWEEFAKNFEASNNYVVGIKDINRVKQRLKKHTDVGALLELGCGNGTYTECFVEQAERIVATDVSQPMIEVSKIRFENELKVVVEQADCFALRYEDNSFDTVFMANLLHVIPNPVSALEECLRVLKPGGRLIGVSFTLHNMNCFNKLRLKYRYWRKYGLKNNNSIVLTPVLAHELAATAGFQDVSTEMLGKRVKAVYFTAFKLDE